MKVFRFIPVGVALLFLVLLVVSYFLQPILETAWSPVTEWRAVRLWRGRMSFMRIKMDSSFYQLHSPEREGVQYKITRDSETWFKGRAVRGTPNGKKFGGAYWHNLVIAKHNEQPLVRHLRFDMPLWIPILLSAVAAAYFHRRAPRHPSGSCSNCGYNLTGNTSGVCPECGTARPA